MPKITTARSRLCCPLRSVNLPKQKRQRGVIPTPEGLKKLQAAILALEREDTFEHRLTQEKISQSTGLARRTIRKIFNREGLVSLSTLTTLFSAFNLELQPSDYLKPTLHEDKEIESSHPSWALRCDWGEAIDVSIFRGRQSELETLQQWIVNDRCRLVALLGMGGIGKTSLSIKLAQQIQEAFEAIIWRSLRNAPSVSILLSEWVQFVSHQQDSSADMRQLMHYLRTSRCLLILDNVETILEPGKHAGHYRAGYEGYGELFRVIGETPHKSCLILTSREKPGEIAALEGLDLFVRSLTLKGCSEAAQALLEAKELSGSAVQKQQLAERYGNSPLAVKIVANFIQDLFDGNIEQFLAQNTTFFNSIRYLLAQQFERLGELEQTIMYWLAINREWTSLSELETDLVPSITRAELLEALESLSWRSLIEKHSGSYTQQPVVMEYVTDRLLTQATKEITGDISPPVRAGLETLPYTLSSPVRAGLETRPYSSLLKRHALLKAQGKDYIRQTQIRLILEPLTQELLKIFGTRERFQGQLTQILSTFQEQSSSEPSYLAGNILNLLCHLQTDLSNYDFSDLTIWQADLRGVNLHQVNFTGANLAKSVFTKTFGSVYALVFSPDNQQLATGHADGEIRLWQVDTGQLLFSATGHTSSVWTLAFSPDGQTLASGGFDQTIKLWNLQTGLESITLQGHSDWVRGVAFSPDGKFLASCSSDQTIKIWDSRTGGEVQTLRGHTAQVTTISFSPQGHLLLSGSEDQTLRLWDIESGQCLKTFKGHTNLISSAAFSADGQTLASCEEQKIKLWNVNTGECYQTLQSNLTLVWAVTFSPDGQTLAGSDGKTLRLWDVNTGKCDQILSGYTSQVWALAFSANGQILAGSDDETVMLWCIETGQCLRTWRGYTDSVRSYWSLAFSADAQTLASGSGDGAVRLWDISTGKYLRTLNKHSKAVRTVAFSSSDVIDRMPVLLASGGEDCAIELWEVHTGVSRQSLLGHTDKVWSVAFSADGQTLASGSADRTIKLWDIQTGRCLKTLSGHTGQVLSVAFSPISPTPCETNSEATFDSPEEETAKHPLASPLERGTGGGSKEGEGGILASGSEDRTVKLWDLNTGRCQKTLVGHQGWVWSVVFSPDGQIVASGGEDRTIKLWDINTGRCLDTLQGHSQLIWSITFSPDGQTLISGSADQTAKLWDLRTFQCLKTFQGNTDLVWAFIYHSKGQILASGSIGEMIQLWDLQAEKFLTTLRSPRLYEGMKISGVTGLTSATIVNLKALGAVDR